MIIKKYNIGAKKRNIGSQTDPVEDLLEKKFNIERQAFRDKLQEQRDVINANILEIANGKDEIAVLTKKFSNLSELYRATNWKCKDLEDKLDKL